ncbi:MAG: phage antirepressor protein [Lentisphaerae bacterium RIFOXYB12_FULL_65_16]|nr:MAG: phage antirepressor protein [Lentisphaerae bacterium RIFOXYA12_64_32]OGV92474.1 MAG: phage antirepressor protein [Lentisphaerae bacterium RIFOXYB12_FULL_65_16]
MSDTAPNPETRIALFQHREIRRTIHNNEWWFVIADVVAALTDSVDPQGYLKDMRRRDPELAKGWGQIATPLSIATAGGAQNLNCANTEGLFRIIQSIPSPKAEPFKRWLAKVGYERIQEIEDPELATKRTRALYKAKGYSDDWIEKRMRSIAIRDELTDEWKKRGVREQREYAILTAEISEATFGLTPSQYAEFKRLKRENLRDHMTDLELIFSMLGEAATTEITRTRDAQDFPESKQAARAGGTVAGNARRELEEKSGRKVVTSDNFLGLTQAAKKAGALAQPVSKKKRAP